MNTNYNLATRADTDELLLRMSSGTVKDFLKEMQIYRAAIKEVKTKLENLDDSFQVRYEYNPIHHIETRLKSVPSIIGKLERMQQDLTIENMSKYLHDIAGVRVICNYFDDMEKLADMLLSQDDIRLVNRKDYHKHPKENGYRSLHLVIETPVFLANEKRNVMVEIQIRTIAMDLWASLEHQLRYKNLDGISVPEELSKRLYNCSQVLTGIDTEMQSIYDEILRRGGHEVD